MKKGKTGTYARDGMAVEVMATSCDSYEELIHYGQSSFKFDPPTKKALKLALFTMSGTMIPKSGDWTLGEYVKRIKKSEAKIGIGYVEVRVEYVSIWGGF